MRQVRVIAVLLALGVGGCAGTSAPTPVSLADKAAQMQQEAEAKEAWNQKQRAQANKEENARYADCVTGTTPYYKAIEACFIERGQPLVAASQEQPETIAAAVDGACQQPKAALVRKFLACMSVDGATSVVEKYASAMRSAVVSAVVEHRAGVAAR